jgi:sulfur carrier protein
MVIETRADSGPPFFVGKCPQCVVIGENRRMNILLNGSPHDCADDTTLADLLAANGYAGRRVAVEINRDIVPRSAHATTPLKAGDQVEIVHAMGGG